MQWRELMYSGHQSQGAGAGRPRPPLPSPKTSCQGRGAQNKKHRVQRGIRSVNQRARQRTGASAQNHRNGAIPAVQIGDTPIEEVTPKQCEAAVKAVKAHATASKTGTDGSGQARRHFGLLRHLFNGPSAYASIPRAGLGLETRWTCSTAHPPAGKAVQRRRTLDDAELAAVGQAADVIGYPVGELVHGLILTGLRRDELAEMRSSEIQPRRALDPDARNANENMKTAIPCRSHP